MSAPPSDAARPPPARAEPPPASPAPGAAHEHELQRMAHLFRASVLHGYLHPLYLPLLKYRQAGPAP